MGLKIAQSREELARLKAHQNEVRYQSGEVRLPVVLGSRKDVLEAQKSSVRQTLEYNKAVLNLREISGDLSKSYVRASSWED
jgi:outer membrane protein TolC